MKSLLVIGYGNTIRSDDGAGPAAAKALRDRHPDIDCIAVHGLEPVLAETLSHYDQVVFIDAAEGIERTTFSTLRPVDLALAGGTHASSPGALLRMSADLYNRLPEATMIRIPAYDMGFGESLSDKTRLAVGECVAGFERRFTCTAAAW